MSILDRLLGRAPSATTNTDGADVESVVTSLKALYDDPEVKSERGLSLTGPRANEVRTLGRRLHKSGGKERMEVARDAMRERHGWAIANIEAIWASLPEWRT